MYIFFEIEFEALFCWKVSSDERFLDSEFWIPDGDVAIGVLIGILEYLELVQLEEKSEETWV